MSDLRAGLVGYGQMGRHHARVLTALDGVELVGVADPVLTSASPMPVVPDVDMLLDLGIDLAIIATPTATHAATGLRLADAGVATLIEKPVAGSVEDALLLADAFDAAGVVGCVGHIERYNPAIRELRRRLADNELGAVYQIATRRQGPFPARISDVGVVLDLATHDIDLTSWVTQSRYAAVTAHTAHRSGRHNEDLVAVVGLLEDGTVVSHLVNWLSPLKERVVVVTGERGCFSADILAADLTYYANGVAPVQWDTLASFRGVVQGDVTTFAIAKPEPLAAELSEFLRAVRGEPSDVVLIREAAEVVAVAHKIMRSSRAGLPDQSNGGEQR